MWLPNPSKRRCSATCEPSRGCSGTWRAALALPAGTQHPGGPVPAPAPALLLARQAQLSRSPITEQLSDASLTTSIIELLHVTYSLSLELSPSWICSLQATGRPAPSQLIHLGMAIGRAVPCPRWYHYISICLRALQEELCAPLAPGGHLESQGDIPGAREDPCCPVPTPHYLSRYSGSTGSPGQPATGQVESQAIKSTCR